MSTEALEASDSVKKKRRQRKSKNNTDSSTKKRKRDSEAAPEDQTSEVLHAEERPTKKHKDGEEKARPVAKQLKTKKTQGEKPSPFIIQTTSFYLPLSPCAQDFAIEGLCAEHISPSLLTYFAPLKGILISYENPRISELPDDGQQSNGDEQPTTVLSRSINEYAVNYVWFTADFLVFKPVQGTYLHGTVLVQNESMLGLVCYNYFNAMIERDKLPKDWKWVESEEDATSGGTKSKAIIPGAGHFVDGANNEIKGDVVFKVDDFETNTNADGGMATVSILGTLRFDEDET